MKNIPFFENMRRSYKIALEFALMGVVGCIDVFTGYELAFSLFYVIPVSFAAWYIDRRHGIVASLLSALVWHWADVASGNTYSSPFIPVWNTLIRLSFFLIIALLLSALKKALVREEKLAGTDHLTGAVNSRIFYEMVQMEIDRLKRYTHPFTLVYIDLDNFKTVNDQQGHPVGDQVLIAVVSCAKMHLRSIDVVARIGGDEFALLLPETNQESAQVAISKLHVELNAAMRQSNWPITFSGGVLSCIAVPSDPCELVKLADELMYSAKHGGKNAFIYSSYTEAHSQ